MQIEKKVRRPLKVKVDLDVDVWRCEDLKEMLGEAVRAHVKDVELARKLEAVLADEVAYGTGGGGNVGVA